MLNFNLIEKLKIVLHIGTRKKQSVGILNKGKHNTFIALNYEMQDNVILSVFAKNLISVDTGILRRLLLRMTQFGCIS